ncbi:MAG: D-glycero-beta-D-manno-heptose 1,7-bisphosphate 7-phosphatase [Woeseiaceae bacterium]
MGEKAAGVRLVILDRDGVINHDSADFIRSPEDWVAIDGSLDAIRRLNRHGYTVAVASNQSGVGRGLFDLATLDAIHRRMCDSATAAGGRIDRVVYCPHRPGEGCACRKPKPGLLLDLARHYGVPLEGVPVIGDSLRDIEAAQAAGARPVLVLTGNGRDARLQLGADAPETHADLAAAVDALTAEVR